VLGDRYLSVSEIARGCGTHPRSTRLLLNACVALGFLHKRGGRYGNSEQARELLVKGRPAYLGDAIGHAEHLYLAWGQLTEAVRTNRRVAPTGRLQHAGVPRLILAMHTGLRSGEALARRWT
jgi:hypothetical protein